MGNYHSINLDQLDDEEYLAYQESLQQQCKQTESIEGEWEDTSQDPNFWNVVNPPQQQQRISLPPRAVVQPSSSFIPQQIVNDFPITNAIDKHSDNDNCNENNALLGTVALGNKVEVDVSDENNNNNANRYLPRSLSLTLGNEKLHLDFVEKLGEGGFGSVARAVDYRGVSFAVKSIYCLDPTTYDEAVFSEVVLLFNIDHPNIVKLHGFDVVQSTAILVMEYCGDGTLNNRLNQPIDFTLQLRWMEQTASALMYLHEHDIVHRDLKTDNILLSNNHVKIADFGLARHFVCCTEGKLFNNNNYLTHYNSRYMATLAGTPFWLAPEVFDEHYNEKADIFSLGLIFYAICERRYSVFQGQRYYGGFVVYKGKETGVGFVMHELKHYVQPVFSSIRSFKLQQVINDMLSYEASVRASLSTVRDEVNEVFAASLEV